MKCYHCGLKCPPLKTVFFESKPFCCSGCKMVYQIINENSLEKYYEMNSSPGVQKKLSEKNYYDILDNSELQNRFVFFEDEKSIKVKLSIPEIHCSSCLWLLENSGKLNQHILHSQVNFSRKEAVITLKKPFSLKELCILLDKIGYKPDLKESTGKNKNANNSIYYKIGIAGFCFGNIMLLSFPNYLDQDPSLSDFKLFFGYLSLLLSIPVFFYSGGHYLKNAFKAIRGRFINMDIPITIGMVALFIRSFYEVISHTGEGYLDSLSGFIFFLLIGKLIQQRTYDNIVFNRDYKSYFPLGITCIENDKNVIKKIEDLKPNDIVSLRNGELIPADGTLLSDHTHINYSFVTGESDLSLRKKDDTVFAGGIIHGRKIQVKLKKRTDNSYLTELWNQDVFTESRDGLNNISNHISRFFTWIVLGIAFFSGLYWYFTDPEQTWNIVTAILIVACPCALALSMPLTLGNIMQFMGQSGFYLKNNEVIEDVSKITDIILDKTGTITHREKNEISYNGMDLSKEEKSAIISITGNSIHPLSMAIHNFLKDAEGHISPDHFEEFAGQGIEGSALDLTIKLGSAKFLDLDLSTPESQSSEVHLSINNVYKGVFSLKQHYREGLNTFIGKVLTKFGLHLLSGDNDSERPYLESLLKTDQLHFNLLPIEKMDYIKSLQESGRKVMMLGDGLNDAGALKQSDVGIAISDNIHYFSPACDAILDAQRLNKLGDFITLSKKGLSIVKWSFFISFIYNIVGLFVAITGQLSPIVAAILMPLSATSVAVFTSLATRVAKKQLRI